MAFVKVPIIESEDVSPVMFKRTPFDRATIVEEGSVPSSCRIETDTGVQPSIPTTTVSSLCSGREIRARGDVMPGSIPVTLPA